MEDESQSKAITYLADKIRKVQDLLNTASMSADQDTIDYCTNVIEKNKIADLQNILDKFKAMPLRIIKSDTIYSISDKIAQFEKYFPQGKCPGKSWWNSFNASFIRDFVDLENELEILTIISKITFSSYEYEGFNKSVDDLELAKKNHKKMESECNRIIEILKTVSDEDTAKKYCEHFANLADDYQKNANKFLNYTVVFIIIIAIFAVGLLFFGVIPSTDNKITSEVLQALAYRLILFSVLFFALSFFAKNYLNERHNIVINKHREKAVKTFRVFTETQQSADVREKITLLAAYCIFGHQTTGFLKNNKDDDNNINIWSIIESVIAKKTTN